MKATVKHYAGSETVTLKAFHDEWEVLEPRDEVQELADHINISQQSVVADESLNTIAQMCHEANAKWWRDLKTGEPIERNHGELLALIHSEISEALEADRKGLMDDKLPHRNGVEVELADALIRILDTAAGLGLDIGGAFVEKMAFNAQRADHKAENRKASGGKKY